MFGRFEIIIILKIVYDYRYATSFLLQRTGNAPFEVYYDAGRRGRSGDDCRQLYLACNEV